MLKRPSRRVKPVYTNDKNHRSNVEPGSLLHGILNPVNEPVYFKFTKGAVYNADIYFKMLEKNNKQMNIPYIQPNLPELRLYREPVRIIEPTLDVPDRVYLKLKILKKGIVRVKLDTVFATLHERWYQQMKTPPMKSVLNAYKVHGFSDHFLEKIKKGYEKKKIQQIRIEKVFDSIFNKDVIKRQKKKDKELREKKDELEKLTMDEIEEEEEEEENDVPEDEIDVDVDEDEDEEVVEEEYLSD